MISGTIIVTGFVDKTCIKVFYVHNVRPSKVRLQDARDLAMP